MKRTTYLILVFILFLLAKHPILAQQIKTIDDFSTAYYAKLYFDESTQKGWTAIYNRDSGKECIRIETVAFTAFYTELSASEPEKRSIRYEDVNFDGKKDFLLQDGSCIEFPTFQVYLANETGFVQNEPFTELTRCGWLWVNTTEKKLSVYVYNTGTRVTHYSEYLIQNNIPTLVYEKTEDAATLPFETHTTETWNGQQRVTNVEIWVHPDSTSILFSFTLQKNGKEVVLFESESRLHYVLLQPDGKVEFTFPFEAESTNPAFTFSSYSDETRQTLVFRNKDATYTLYDIDTPTEKRVGIDVQRGGKTYHLIGNISSRQGSLQSVYDNDTENVTLAKAPIH